MDRSARRRIFFRSLQWRQLVWVWVFALLGNTAFASEPCGTGSYPFPFTDVAAVSDAFCPGILEAYVTGVSKGATATMFGPNADVTRLQMTTFLQRSLDQGLARSSRKAPLNQWWTPQTAAAMQMIPVGGAPAACAADGDNIWTANNGQVVQVEASTGKVLGTWTGATQSSGVFAVAGKIFTTDGDTSAKLFLIDPTQAPGAVTVAASNLGGVSYGIAFDGTNLWTANHTGSVSIITLQATIPYPVATVAAGFTSPIGILYDGSHIWVTDSVEAGKLFKLDAAGAILQAVSVGSFPSFPVFDGTNIWVPNNGDNSVSVVQASTGNVVATIQADANNHLDGPASASFDGERILVTNNSGNTVTVFKAADLSLMANVTTGASSSPRYACSDGINFWVPLAGDGKLLRF